MAQSIDEQIGVFPAVKAEHHFVEVRLEMFCADVMPSAHDSALEEREGRLGGIGVNQTGYIFLLVLDCLMLCSLLFVEGERVDRPFIGDDDFHIFAQVVPKNFAHGLSFGVSGMNQAELAAALTDTDYHLLFGAWYSLAKFPAYIRLVDLHSAIEHPACFFHRSAYPVAEVPSCFVTSDSESALNLTGGDALLCFTDEKCGNEPLFERKVRVIKNCSSSDGELIVTGLAVEEMLVSFEQHDRSLAAQTARAFWEAQASQEFAAFGIGGEHRVNVN